MYKVTAKTTRVKEGNDMQLGKNTV
jgi:hypothetical protein